MCDQGWTSPAGGPWLHAEPRGGDDSSMLRHERQTVAAALHHSRGGELVANDGLRAQRTASAGPAEFYELSSDEGRPAGGERPLAMPEPRPQAGIRRHTGVGFELVLDPVVLQLGAEVAEGALHAFLFAAEKKEEEEEEKMERINDRLAARGDGCLAAVQAESRERSSKDRKCRIEV